MSVDFSGGVGSADSGPGSIVRPRFTGSVSGLFVRRSPMRPTDAPKRKRFFLHRVFRGGAVKSIGTVGLPERRSGPSKTMNTPQAAAASKAARGLDSPLPHVLQMLSKHTGMRFGGRAAGVAARASPPGQGRDPLL